MKKHKQASKSEEKQKTQILTLSLSYEELDELRVTLEFAGLMAMDLAASQVHSASDNQMKALKRIASSSASLLATISNSMKEALANGNIESSTIH